MPDPAEVQPIPVRGHQESDEVYGYRMGIYIVGEASGLAQQYSPEELGDTAEYALNMARFAVALEAIHPSDDQVEPRDQATEDALAIYWMQMVDQSPRILRGDIEAIETAISSMALWILDHRSLPNSSN